MITFELNNNQNITIMKDGKKVGSIFTPSGSAQNKENSVQVCGFREAFDIWGCGRFPGYKDVQLLYVNDPLPGEEVFTSSECPKCYRAPCQCEDKGDNKSPFIAKHHKDIEEYERELLERSI